MKYEVIRTDTADSLIRKIVLYAAENFRTDVALEKLRKVLANDVNKISAPQSPPRCTTTTFIRFLNTSGNHHIPQQLKFTKNYKTTSLL